MIKKKYLVKQYFESGTRHFWGNDKDFYARLFRAMSLRISGIPCDGPPFRLQISQGFNRHGRMTAGLWIPEEMRKELHLDMQVILELDGGGPVFCGVVERATAGKEKGQDCVYIEAKTGSSLLDRKKRNRSFQRQGRSYKELVGEIAAPYQGYPVWKTGSGGETECVFLLQYEETNI